jgi:hypothetical protein
LGRSLAGDNSDFAKTVATAKKVIEQQKACHWGITLLFVTTVSMVTKAKILEYAWAWRKPIECQIR